MPILTMLFEVVWIFEGRSPTAKGGGCQPPRQQDAGQETTSG
jgi:hypothetical protein